MGIIGLTGYHSDSAAAGLADGALAAAVEEERFTRVKHWAGFPARSLAYCFEQACGSSLGELEAIGIAHDPTAQRRHKVRVVAQNPHLWRMAAGRLRHHRRIKAMDDLIAEQLGIGRSALPPVHRVEHHLAHAASAFLCSPFEESMVLTLDGFGDFLSGLRAIGRGNTIEVLDRIHYPHSLGQFYTALTQYVGFPTFGDEYKMMGLAAFGEPRMVDKLDLLVQGTDDGRFRLDQTYFAMLAGGGRQTWSHDGAPLVEPIFTHALVDLLGRPPRTPGDELTQWYKDLAASAQAVFEKHYFRLIRTLQQRTGLKRLALAGGCALNSVANGKIYDQTDVDEVYIQAAAHDGGNSLGAALWVQHVILGRPRNFVMKHALWGPHPQPAQITEALAAAIPGSGGRDGRHDEFEIETFGEEDRLLRSTAAALAAGEVVGWYQGRSEWGPRALGNRSLLADPRRPQMRETLNAKIKRREPFRPFAPSILEERTGEWFSRSDPDPFMLKVYPILPSQRDRIPAVTHVDGTGRLQTVSASSSPRYYELIRHFEAETGVPIVLNTSLNENEPIVNLPTEAVALFLRTNMDRLVMENTVVRRVSREIPL